MTAELWTAVHFSKHLHAIPMQFGKNVTDHDPATIQNVRNPVFKAVFDLLQKSIDNGDVLKG
jgi:hypothetical protein